MICLVIFKITLTGQVPRMLMIRVRRGSFSFGSRYQIYNKFKSNTFNAWAVQSGDATVGWVPQVPVPAAAWLFGSGLLGLIGVAGRKKAQRLKN